MCIRDSTEPINLNRLNRFEHHRYVGIRKNMKVYDCDDEKQFESLNEYLKNYDYVSLNLVQSFSPDNIDEAKNRGFRPIK